MQSASTISVSPVHINSNKSQEKTGCAAIIGKLFADSTSLGRICRLAVNTFAIIGKALANTTIFAAVTLRFVNTATIIDTFGVGDQFKFFGAKEHKGKVSLNALAQASLLVAGVGGIAVLAAELVLLSLGKTCEKLGAFATIGAKVVTGFAGLGFVFFAANNIRKLVNLHKEGDKAIPQKKTVALLSLASNVADIALAALCIVSLTTVIPIIAVGTASAVLGLTSFIYKARVEKQIKQTAHNV